VQPAAPLSPSIAPVSLPPLGAVPPNGRIEVHPGNDGLDFALKKLSRQGNETRGELIRRQFYRSPSETGTPTLAGYFISLGV